MDQIKIGKFISSKRKEKNITQNELAAKLNISDRAISKWENGICLPDASNMSELCKILDISINDLFSGEVVNMKDYDKRIEENLLNLKKENEEKDKRLLNLEIAMSIPTIIISIVLMIIAKFIEMPTIISVIIIVLSLVLILTICAIALFIEQKAGYYECDKCHYKYVPTYTQVLFAPHINRIRYMKCPKCKKRSWNKKVINKK